MTALQKLIAFLDTNVDVAWDTATLLADEWFRDRLAKTGKHGRWQPVFRREYKKIMDQLEEDWHRDDPKWDKDDDENESGSHDVPADSPSPQGSRAKSPSRPR